MISRDKLQHAAPSAESGLSAIVVPTDSVDILKFKMRKDLENLIFQGFCQLDSYDLPFLIDRSALKLTSHARFHSDKPSTIRPKTLLLLPNELILEIFRSIDDTLDAILLGLAAERLWKVGETIIIRLLSKLIAPWNGSRLICVGEYVGVNDLPPSIAHDQTLLERIESTWTDDNREPSLFDLCEQFSNTPRCHLNSYVCQLRWHPRPSRLRDRERFGTPACANYQLSEWARSDSRIRLHFDPETDDLVLRNLSKMLYIRQSGITPTPLINALITRICWSTDPSLGMDYEKVDISRGPWAGDAFDVRLLSTHEEEVKKGKANLKTAREGAEKTWTDVTKEVADHLAEIWECEFGEKWREELESLFDW